MTDNRTNELGKIRQNDAKHFAWSEAQVEAAAKAHRKHGKGVEYAGIVCRECDEYFEDRAGFEAHRMRAALVAAQGAAPQAEVLPETGNELRDEDGDLISSGKHLRILHQGGYVCDTCTNVLGLNVRWDHAVKRNDHAPVLPSSGVDESKMAEVIRRADAEWQVREARLETASKLTHAQFVARAVAEWRKDREVRAVATGKQIRAIRGAAYDLVSAAVRQVEAEYVNHDSKTSARLANKVKAHRARFEEALSALAGKEKNE